MDVKMPCMGAVEATRAIKKVLPVTHVMSVSSQDDTLTRDAMTKARITGLEIGGDPFLEDSS